MILFGINIPVVEILLLLHVLVFFVLFRLRKNVQRL
jgi:hypothetical protein